MSKVETVTLPLSQTGCNNLQLDSYSLKIQDFISRSQYQEVVDRVNKIHRKYTTVFVFSIIFMIIFAILPSFSGLVVSVASIGTFYLFLFGSLGLMMFFLIVMVYVQVKMVSYRKKQMAKWTARFSEKFPGTNWIYRQRGAGKTVSYYLEVEFQHQTNNAVSLQAPMPMQRNGEPVFMPNQPQMVQPQGQPMMVPMQQNQQQMQMQQNQQQMQMQQPMMMPMQQNQQMNYQQNDINPAIAYDNGDDLMK
eukprot:TRINITY_DN3248_c0_g1_i1.p1 TRINITY_DN3248_c0_g1~~TRINITY_DN3248_c0_g1_i1.p1  ORF type:complete len:249 (-),score=51.93 TRINITY_DN3248_c0_g1_i1:214-960(-)